MNYANVVRQIEKRRGEREGPTAPVAGQIPGWAVAEAAGWTWVPRPTPVPWWRRWWRR